VYLTFTGRWRWTRCRLSQEIKGACLYRNSGERVKEHGLVRCAASYTVSSLECPERMVVRRATL